ncbi:MAG TPA: hypothetical protein VLI05_03455 [Candidatus Saccharimonadia bacterium]|nr:hypothetical protein [Candidatus Saccharimonadia bacterium]
MLDLTIKQAYIDESSETALEEFKSTFVELLNSNPSDRYTEQRWEVTRVSEGEVALLIYDERPVASFRITDKALRFWSDEEQLVRYDDIMYAVRLAARELGLAVFSQAYGGVRLPTEPSLALDHSFFHRNADFAHFFEHSQFTPRYCLERYETKGATTTLAVGAPIYVQDKATGAMHLVNSPALDYLVQKDNQTPSAEFSYQVADSMDDFAKKYDAGLIPQRFYRNYQRSVKIVNNTDFDIYSIDRKVFIDPYVWDFDAEHGKKYYQNVKNGLHLMDKVRRGEDLDTAIKRILREELQVGDDYVGACIWGIDFDRDREGLLTPRLKLNVYVHGLAGQRRSQSHDWVSIKP